MATQDATLFGGPFLGLHGFLSDSISLDPAFELMMVGRAHHQDDYDGAYSGTGLRVGVTLSLTGWLGGHKTKATAAAGVSVEASAEQQPRSEPSVVAAQLNFNGFSVYLYGKPETRGDLLRLSARRLREGDSAWQECPLELMGDAGLRLAVKTEHDVHTVGLERNEEEIAGVMRFSDLEQWSQRQPSVLLCGWTYPLNPQNQLTLALALRRFKGIATRAGTYRPTLEATVSPPPAVEGPLEAEPRPAGEAPAPAAPAPAPEPAPAESVPVPTPPASSAPEPTK